MTFTSGSREVEFVKEGVVHRLPTTRLFECKTYALVTEASVGRDDERPTY